VFILLCHFSDVLNIYFKKKLEELNTIMAGSYESDQLVDIEPFQSNTSDWHSGMDIDGSEVSESSSLVKNIGKVVRDLRCIGFTSMTEDAYSSAIIWLLKVCINYFGIDTIEFLLTDLVLSIILTLQSKVYELAGDDYRVPVLGCVKKWIQVPSHLTILQSTKFGPPIADFLHPYSLT
jgi:anaphase-promoting complex subunit 2